MLVFAASAAAEDKPSGDNTAAQWVRLRVAWLAIQFLAAATGFCSVEANPWSAHRMRASCRSGGVPSPA